ncbi:signal recognition particle-docking protein FtsY [Aerolutibacter ruishenii]|uniref:Signal recognition particle receptor FtsY n=1 Tax=Aerolutibacter ruishenii TaxID=686800 RepID=A0A562LSS9_9GAMM|nr:signal recognition particle-docking protein FtsY [Lysobacter ruishenii]TWI10669.1 fused signal recognition particle receptor [Lysobacter ruishenii]
MLSFFRRKKPDAADTDTAKRPSLDELAAAFPNAPAPGTAESEAAPQAADGALTGDASAAPPGPVDAAPTPPAQPSPTAPVHRAPAEPVPAEVIAAALESESVPGRLSTSGTAGRADALDAALAPSARTAPEESPEPVAAAEDRKGWRDRLRGSAFARAFGGLFSRNPKLDDDLLDEIETALLTADVGVAATTQLVESLRKRMKAREFADAQALLAALRNDLLAMLRPVAVPLQIDRNARPFVLLTVGVNGVGKTTTIGKLAKRFKDEGRPLMLAAGDTFRAAAVAQLQAWGDRNGVPVVAQGQNADAASVAFDALQAAKSRGTEVLIADTAGRLHTQQGLMAELGKIKRVLAKLDPAAPHEVLMVIDGTTGQNALSQLRQFHAAVGVTGLVVTKLDGTAKGGVVFALAREFGIPIRFAGIGERPEDLRVFDAEAFVDALLPEALGA